MTKPPRLVDLIWKYAPELSRAQREVLLYFDYCTDKRTGWAKVSMPTISERTGMSDRWCRKTIRDLEADGWLVVMQRRGRTWCNLYRVRRDGFSTGTGNPELTSGFDGTENRNSVQENRNSVHLKPELSSATPLVSPNLSSAGQPGPWPSTVPDEPPAAASQPDAGRPLDDQPAQPDPVLEELTSHLFRDPDGPPTEYQRERARLRARNGKSKNVGLRPAAKKGQADREMGLLPSVPDVPSEVQQEQTHVRRHQRPAAERFGADWARRYGG